MEPKGEGGDHKHIALRQRGGEGHRGTAGCLNQRPTGGEERRGSSRLRGEIRLWHRLDIRGNFSPAVGAVSEQHLLLPLGWGASEVRKED